MITGHGGDIFDAAAQVGCRPADIVDMSSNINPIGPMPALVEHLADRLDAITRLPDIDARSLAESFAAGYRLPPGNVLAGSGTTEFIYSLPQALAPRKVLILGPTYADYADACRRHPITVEHCLSEQRQGFIPDLSQLDRMAGRFEAVFICNPNNPTGALIPAEKIADLCRRHPHTCFVVDESYLPFATAGRQHSLINALPGNAVVLQSLSKIFRIPGLRVGFLVADKPLADKFRPWMLPWNVNGLAQAAAQFLITNRQLVEQFVEQSIEVVRIEREKLMVEIAQRTKADCYPSETVFFLVRLPPDKTAAQIKSALLQHRILIRDCSNFTGLSERYIRISVKTAEFNRLLADRLVEELNR